MDNHVIRQGRINEQLATKWCAVQTTVEENKKISSEDEYFCLLAKWDDFRQTDWVIEIEFPELTLQQTQDLLSIPV